MFAHLNWLSCNGDRRTKKMAKKESAIFQENTLFYQNNLIARVKAKSFKTDTYV